MFDTRYSSPRTGTSGYVLLGIRRSLELMKCLHAIGCTGRTSARAILNCCSTKEPRSFALTSGTRPRSRTPPREGQSRLRRLVGAQEFDIFRETRQLRSLWVGLKMSPLLTLSRLGRYLHKRIM